MGGGGGGVDLFKLTCRSKLKKLVKICSSEASE